MPQKENFDEKMLLFQTKQSAYATYIKKKIYANF